VRFGQNCPGKDEARAAVAGSTVRHGLLQSKSEVNFMKLFSALLLATLVLPAAAHASTAEYEGVAAYEFHFDPPTLYVTGEAAAHLKQDLKFTPKRRKITLTVDCQDAIGEYPASCELVFPIP
jgi:hypothetical protein